MAASIAHRGPDDEDHCRLIKGVDKLRVWNDHLLARFVLKGSAMRESSGNPEFKIGRPGKDLAATVEEIQSRLALLEKQISRSDGPNSASSGQVRSHIQARTLRYEFFNWELFSDPTWDILLELYAVKLELRRLAISELCVASSVPLTTALRWIGNLEREGLITRRNDPLDGRRVWVELSDTGCDAMRRYFDELSFSALPQRRQ